VFPTGFFGKAVELTHHHIHEIGQILYHLDSSRPLPMALLDGLSLRLDEVPEEAEEGLPLPYPASVAFQKPGRAHAMEEDG
jgi:hypothetical protein